MNSNAILIAAATALLIGLSTTDLSGQQADNLSALPRYFASPKVRQHPPHSAVDQRITVAERTSRSPDTLPVELSNVNKLNANSLVGNRSSFAYPTSADRGCCNTEICDDCRPRMKFCRIPGFNGHPYESKPVNGCRCGHPCQRRLYPNLNPHWPTPFANMQRYCPPDQPTQHRPRDQLDRLAKIRISNYQRRDNGYSGRQCDGFGLLGESYYKSPAGRNR